MHSFGIHSIVDISNISTQLSAKHFNITITLWSINGINCITTLLHYLLNFHSFLTIVKSSSNAILKVRSISKIR